jgi:hypothetical protein
LISHKIWIVLAAELAFQIPPVPVSIKIAGQAVSIPISGDVSGESEQALHLRLHADLADLQSHLTPILQAELNQSNRCGERISIENSTLIPAAPAGNLTVQLHFEKWACIKAFGKENAKRLLGGNGAVVVILTPRVEDGKAVRLDAAIGRIDADGSLGEALHSGSLGAALRDKIRDALVKAIEKAADLNAVVPEQARPFASIESAVFADGGSNRLQLNLAARLAVPARQASLVLEQLHNRR